jgi:NhaP-type Na+/H+ or K+/H+ antiporter
MLSLTVIRMIPVAIALIGSGAQPATVGFLGWFGPRGLASIVFAVIVVSDADLLHTHIVVTAVITTIALSVVAHGVSAVPAARWYSSWYARHPDRGTLMEGADVARQRWRRRGAAHRPS